MIGESDTIARLVTGYIEKGGSAEIYFGGTSVVVTAVYEDEAAARILMFTTSKGDEIAIVPTHIAAVRGTNRES